MTTTPATPPLLKTYQEARLLWEAKNWKLTGVADELGEKPELKRFHISHTKLSKKTTSERPSPIEPEVAAAIEALETRPGCERQVEIVTRGLLALHGAAPVPAPVEAGSVQGEEEAAPVEDVAKVLKELRDALPGELVEALEAKVNARDGKLIDALEEKAGARESKLIDALEERAAAREGGLVQELARLGRFSWTRAIPGGVGAFLGSLIVVPLLLGFAAVSVGTPGFTYRPPGRPDASPRWFEPGSALAVFEWGEKPPVDQTVPDWTLPGQRVAPCDEGLGEVAINGNCWTFIADVKPPCGRLFRHGDKCYRPIAADPKKPTP